MKLKPLSDRVLVEPIQAEEKTSSGIILPDTVEKAKVLRGTVTAVGPGKLNEKGERIPLGVKVGDKVMFKKPWSEDDKLEIDGKEQYLVDENDILGIIEK
ncbi:MAG: co-chaperone GroES [Candidatus Wolfebacteria bacterium]|nr:co-chaperone GroES [Candidatus Wolfebacteria bacterium]MDP2703882.1 co-chaperone GroES [bacterium]